jgi:DNA repair protein RAD16
MQLNQGLLLLTSSQAEKTTVALYQYHPELKTIWGDVEASIPVVAPVKAPQPAGLKCTLLPFQQESLHWMQEQEQGEWHGGVLADEMGLAYLFYAHICLSQIF